MKNRIGGALLGICGMLFVIGIPATANAGAPRGIAGFVLGEDISKYQEKLLPATALPVRYAESITEVEVKVMDGFKSGIVAYASCAYPGKILRLKFKYANDSREFFEELVQQVKMRFGGKAQWRGDPFQNVLAWKWSFKDVEGRNISMIIQHNREDTDEKIGNTVKLAWMDAIEKEQACFRKDHPEPGRPKKGASKDNAVSNERVWEVLLPK